MIVRKICKRCGRENEDVICDICGKKAVFFKHPIEVKIIDATYHFCNFKELRKFVNSEYKKTNKDKRFIYGNAS